MIGWRDSLQDESREEVQRRLGKDNQAGETSPSLTDLVLAWISSKIICQVFTLVISDRSTNMTGSFGPEDIYWYDTDILNVSIGAPQRHFRTKVNGGCKIGNGHFYTCNMMVFRASLIGTVGKVRVLKQGENEGKYLHGTYLAIALQINSFLQLSNCHNWDALPSCPLSLLRRTAAQH